MSNLIKCIAIDDEPLALDIIEKFCQRYGGIELTTFVDPVKGLEAIRQTHPQIVFLDIEMENLSGLDIAASLPEGTCFIFTTAYLKYTLDGFQPRCRRLSTQAVCLQPFPDRACQSPAPHRPAADRDGTAMYRGKTGIQQCKHSG